MQASSSTAYSQAMTLGKYRLLAELGHGGMASVFLAANEGPAGFAKLIVLKEIKPELAEDPEFLAMFLDEARLAARLSHPNIVQTNEVGQDGQRYFIAMEYLDGQPYNRMVSRLRDKNVPLAAHVKILSEVLAGLHHAHDLCDFDGTPLGVVHRDATPQNVFVTYDGQVKVVDFGIAKAVTSSSETATGVMKGKVAYMAPEQAQGERVDRRADVFAVGVMLWEAAVGRRMWKGVPDLVVLQKVISGQIPLLREVNPDAPERLEQICKKALAYRRDERYESAAAMQADLDAFYDELPDRMNLRDVGKLLAGHFSENRNKIKAIVETQLTSISAQGDRTFDGAPLPIIEGSTMTSDTRRIRGSQDEVSRSSLMTPAPHSGSTQTTSAAAVEAPPPARSRNTVPILIAAGAVGIIAALVLLLRQSPPPPDAALAAPVVATSHVLSIDSTPSGASVEENGKTLGTTPLAIPLDPAQSDVRRFVIAKEGFEAYTFTQPASQADVRFVAALAAAAAPAESATAEPKAPPKAPPPRAVPKTPPPKATTPAPTGTSLTIRTER